MGLGERCKLPQRGLGQIEPQSKSNLVYFSFKIWRLVATLIIFLRINWPHLLQCASHLNTPLWPHYERAVSTWLCLQNTWVSCPMCIQPVEECCFQSASCARSRCCSLHYLLLQTLWLLYHDIHRVSKKVHPYDFHDNNVKWNPIYIIFGRNVADEICNKTVWNKCQIYSLKITTLSCKMRFNFFILQQWNIEASQFRKLSCLQ